ncbi:MAG: hypothetical protein HDR92_09560 [Bacteroides sp.]|nr:hypothetical protein [Bacteroides sp.]
MINHLSPSDSVKIEIFTPTGYCISTWQGSGFSNLGEAVTAAYEGSGSLNMPAEDYVYTVTDLTRGTSARYRIDAGGHLRILPEEN